MSTSPYHGAGKLLDKILTEHKGLKTVAFSKNRQLQCSKASYAQVCETLRHKSLLDAILNDSGGKLRRSVQFNDTRSKGLLYVLLHELLFGKYKSIRGGGKLKRAVLKHEKDLIRVRDSIVTNPAFAVNGGTSLSRVVPIFPRYARINILKATPEEVVSTLRKDFGGGIDPGIYADEHVPDLLVLSPATSSRLHDHDLVKSGKIILQDKSSCFSALALVRGNNHFTSAGSMGTCDIIDACAAPGNKTSHLASLISHQAQESRLGQKQGKKKTKRANRYSNNEKSKIFAFDRSTARLKILETRLAGMVPDDEQNVDMNCLLQDFLKAEPSDKRFAGVKGILLDPSCSGSGIVNQPDRNLDGGDSDSKERIQSLANFQLVALKHAMSFPNVDRIVYSTCSVYEEENEQVVAKALKETNTSNTGDGEDDDMRWVLRAPACLNHWTRRGHFTADLTPEQAKALIRCDGMDGDNTNGFFVSYFERKRCEGRGKGKPCATKVQVQCPKGVDIYSGQFGVLTKKKGRNTPMVTANGENKKDLNQSAFVTSTDIDTKTRKPKGGERKGKNESLRSKKALKKKAWKKRQMEAKAKRLEQNKKEKLLCDRI